MSDAPWHIFQRGNNRSPCFQADSDYRRYLVLLRELASQFGCAIHSYVLMTNHVHLLLTPLDKVGPSLLMKNLGQRYVQYFNRTHGRTGTLWEGRFRSCLVQDERYLLECYRYIELNPVRASMVVDPGQYPWSSYLANAEAHADPLLTPHLEYLRFAPTDSERRRAYREFVAAGIDSPGIAEIRRATNSNLVLGDDSFKDAIARRLNRKVIPGRPGRRSGPRLPSD